MLERFYYEIVAAPDGAHLVPSVNAVIAADPVLATASEPWTPPTLPRQSDLYALLVVGTAGIALDVGCRERIAYASGGGFPVIPVLESLAGYDFRRAPLDEIAERNAEALDTPERLVRTLLHHGGLRLFEGGGSVFVSYARADSAALAEAIRSELMTAAIGQTVDVQAFPGGDVIQDDIVGRIRTADLVVLIDSEGAARSWWVGEEMDIAHAARVPVVAVTPTVGAFRHAFQAPHVEWEPGVGAAPAVVSVARRLLARKAAFRARVARTLARLAKLRSWTIGVDGPTWTLAGEALRDTRVACVDRAPRAEDVEELAGLVGRRGRGLVVAGSRPFERLTVTALARVGGTRVRATPLPTAASKIPAVASRRPLRRCRVFLSAAMPSESDDVELARATLTPFVVSLTHALVELGGTLVFGGHPSVTPLVHRALEGVSGRLKGHVELHQARMWQTDTTSLKQDVRQGRLFRDAKWHGTGKSAADDVAALRDGMITTGLDAGVFVGGKTSGYIGSRPGIVDEHSRFLAACPGKPVFVVGLAGGAARTVASDGRSISEALRTTADPDLAVALIVAELLDA